jgi:hypothetical protein
LGHAVVSQAFLPSSSSYSIAVTSNGKDWSYKSSFASASVYLDHFKKFNNTFYAYGSNNIFYTSDTSFAGVSWNTHTMNISQNTSDSSGVFYNKVLRRENNNWVSYGYVKTPSNLNLAAKNTSTDNGVTFSTTLFTGLGNSSTLEPVYAITANAVFARWFLHGPYYVSTNQLNFNLHPSNLNQYTAQHFNEWNYVEKK